MVVRGKLDDVSVEVLKAVSRSIFGQLLAARCRGAVNTDHYHKYCIENNPAKQSAEFLVKSKRGSAAPRKRDSHRAK